MLGRAGRLQTSWWLLPIKVGNVNVYSKKLSNEDMKSITGGERCGEEGDYLAWSQAQWTIKGNVTKVIEVEKSELCARNVTSKYIHGRETQPKLAQTCNKLGKSRLHFPKNADHSSEYENYFMKKMMRYEDGQYKGYPGECTGYYTAAYDTNPDDLPAGWINDHTGETMDYFGWIPGQPNGKDERCVVKYPTSSFGFGKTWYDIRCSIAYCGGCENHIKPVFQLRGLCKETKLSVTFTPNNDGERGYLGYTGFGSCGIRYNLTSFQWELFKYAKDEQWTWATSSASRESGVLGMHKWTIYNESRQCSTDFELPTQLSLTACNDAEFTCNDGICIPMDVMVAWIVWIKVMKLLATSSLLSLLKKRVKKPKCEKAKIEVSVQMEAV